ncbi:MAG: hypothetical protein WCP39_05430 [Chlamydiota bacterium]
MRNFSVYFLIFFSLFIPHQGLQAKIQYSLYVTPTGDFGTELDSYWYDVQHSNLSHQVVTQYPPHCTLTSFFDPTQSESHYVNAIPLAIADVLLPRIITIQSRLHRGYQTDTILLTSTYLTALATAFQIRTQLPVSVIKGPPGPSFHVTLRDIVFDEDSKLRRIRALENDINLHANARWRVALYKKDNGVVTLVKAYQLIPAN